ncbi:MAG TPA: TVP38/TMEM64 family protein [Stellaceae bacterium]|nr:TVP38/TMEM64 family protein [Stellaceae bacterium]
MRQRRAGPGMDPAMRRTEHPLGAGRQDGDRLVRGDSRRAILGWIGAGALLVAIGLGWYLLPLGDWALALRAWIVELGLLGIVLYVAIYAVATVLLAPGALLTIAGGFAYGFWGLPVVLAAATIGASLAFLVARHVARDRVRRVLETRRDIAAIDRAIAAGGWKIVLLFRLSPLIPFNLQNYLFGVTSVPFRHYLAATVIGIAPATTLFVYVGALGGTALDGGPAVWALFGAGLLATAAAVILVTRKARALLRETGVGDPPS